MRPIRALMALAVLALGLADAPVRAQAVTSPAPDSVAVTIYRDADRAESQGDINLGWVTGYALITERRTVTIPAGRATIRFEGVAGGILPESAIITGLPQGVREKNLDAELLSARNLYARNLGRPVTWRHTVDGKTVEERAIIRSGPDGAAVIQTRDGYTAAACDGADDRLVYDSVPDGLSAKPTLSVQTDSAAAQQVTITLSYLAWGLDWQASYVATMRPDGKSADLFAWITLANGDATSYADAETLVVAGKIKSIDSGPAPPSGGTLLFRCYSFPRIIRKSSNAVVDSITAQDIGALPDSQVSEAVQRVPGIHMNHFAQQEDLGDLKLYRIPSRTNVASMSQKQVALLDRPAVPVEVIYATSTIGAGDNAVTILLRAQNRKESGLGLPLPSGRVQVFEPHGGSKLLVGSGWIDDKATGEEVEFEVARATQVAARLTVAQANKRSQDLTLTVSNANPFAIRYEVQLALADGYKRSRLTARLGRHHGADVWQTEVPANGTATLRFRLTRTRRAD